MFKIYRTPSAKPEGGPLSPFPLRSSALVDTGATIDLRDSASSQRFGVREALVGSKQQSAGNTVLVSQSMHMYVECTFLFRSAEARNQSGRTKSKGQEKNQLSNSHAII